MRKDAFATLISRGLVRTQHARDAGVDERALRAARERGALVRVRHDAYIDTGQWTAMDAAERHRERVRAAAGALRDPVFSHFSAAAVWGLPLIGTWPSDVHVLGTRRGGGRSWPGVVQHTTDLPLSAVLYDGVVVTDVAATVIGVARVASFATALAMADHAVRSALVATDELAECAAGLGTRRGSRAARRVAERADGRAASPGESLSRARMIELAAPSPELQHVVRDGAGFVGQTDFHWPRLRLVGEFDGRLKYRVAGVDDPRAVEERVWQEKVREDRIRATGLGVTRWTWSTALDPRQFAVHLRSAGVL